MSFLLLKMGYEGSGGVEGVVRGGFVAYAICHHRMQVPTLVVLLMS
jgi:hypothetical protein